LSGLTIYRSSAGSGKTYTLVKEYLSIALQYPLQFSKILAITFTNKATAEMKSRVISALEDLASNKKENLKNELKELLPEGIDITLQARTVLTNILHHYSNFSISTIDSFFNEIVKSLAHELRLSLRFEIELDTNKILSEAIDTLLLKAGKDRELTSWLEEFLFFQLDNDKGWNIRDGLIKVAKKLFDEEYDIATRLPDDIHFKALTTDVRKIKTTFENKMLAFGTQFIEALNKSGYETKDFTQGSRGIGGYFSKISNKSNKSIDYSPNSYTLNAFSGPENWLAAKNKKDVTLVALIESMLYPIASDTYTYLSENIVNYNSSNEVLKSIYIIGILSKINEEVKKYRAEYNVITLNDANRIVRTSVTSADAPLIFEKTGSFYQHYLLDEFQDTSTVQWENIRPLISEALSTNKSALLVGDIKQSIYRWRGGNMDLLHSIAEKQLSLLHSNISSEILDTNFRSTKEIIEFNNNFFSKAADWIQTNCANNIPILGKAYATEQLHQRVPQSAPENGYIKITEFETDNEKTIEEDFNWKERSLSNLVKTIHDLYETGFTAGDITILVRSNHEGNLAASFLYKNGIHNIISADSLLIQNAPQINFLINCLSLLTDPDNALIRKEMEWFLFLNNDINAIDVHQIFGTANKQLLHDFLKEFSEASVMPVDDLVTLIIRYFKLHINPDAYIQRFQDVITEYRDKNPSGLASFLHWWKTDTIAANCSIIMPESQSAIRIMTIHKSKGLQFPVVILPFADWILTPKTSEILWAQSDQTPPFNQLEFWPVSSSKKLEQTVFNDAYIQSVQHSLIDNLNLLYVAFTRSVNHLYISIPKKISSGKYVYSLINDVAEAMQLNKTEDYYSAGKVTLHKAKSSEKEQSLFHPEQKMLSSYPVYNWQERMNLKTEVNFKSKEIEAGLIIHEALALIIDESDLETASIRIKNIYNLSDQESVNLKKELHHIMEKCRSMEWFTGIYQVFTERDFVSSEGKLLRPDRVMIKDKQAIIVDYKTGDEAAAHIKQAREYGSLLEACGYSVSQSWLFYTSVGKMINASAKTD
jgi:ATP-dependent helicase/nuclease subunit A